jgi:hypothetical protein
MDRFKYEFQSEFAKRYLAEGEAKVLLKQLALKFGPLSDSVTERVNSASLTELDAWTSRVLTAATLDEVLR